MNAVHEPSIAGAPETVAKPSEAFGVVSSTFKKSIFSFTSQSSTNQEQLSN
jgi:hypothetical protein